jgi:cysteine desulfurase
VSCGVEWRVIYLDSNATTQPAPEVVEAMLPFLREHWVNPSSGYQGARAVRKAVETARETVAQWLGADGDEVIFTSCGTESINAVHDSVRSLWPERRRLIVGATEHAAVLESGVRWARNGGEMVVLPVDRNGVVDLEVLKDLLRESTAMVSVMWANNETGVIAPMREIVDLAHAAGALVHTDAVQAVGKAAVNVQDVPVDFLSLSGHKVHAAKGVGALFVSRRARFQPLLVGGGQENGRRSGTENVAGLVGLGVAAQLMQEAGAAQVRELRDRFEALVCDQLPQTAVNGAAVARLGSTSSLTFSGVDAAGLLILLDKAGVACSAGSACHAAALHPSHVLEAMGLDAAYAGSTLRFSFSRYNTMDEVELAAAAVVKAVQKMKVLQGDGWVTLPVAERV